jgi:hypothetical protein
MKKQPKLLFLPIAAIAVLLFACSKNSERGLTEGSQQTTRLSASPWFFESAGIDIDRNGTIDNSLPAGSLPACVFDNAYNFYPNGTGLANDSTLRCDTLPALKPFTWGFANNEQNIDLSGAAFFGLSGRFKIYTLNETAFSLSRDTLVTLPMIPQPVTASIIINLNHH